MNFDPKLWEGLTRIFCILFGHKWEMVIGGHYSDGLPYGAKSCSRCGIVDDGDLR